ncbi:MAG: SDR family oxidoreductase [Desulfobacterales bacterium]|nr:SDR family oxidoreductase [Desulfobacterales bacterium]
MAKDIASMFTLEGKTAVIAGASRGIGEEIARVFSLAGAQVVLSSRKEEGIKEATEKIKATGGEALSVVANISHMGDCEKLVRESMDWAGKIDILVNNAGTNPAWGPLEDVQELAWDKIFAVNLKGAFFTSQLAYKAWMKEHGGVIIHTASVGGFGTAHSMNVYNITKAAMIHMTKCMASEWKSQGVRVNAIAPGIIKTRLSQALWDNPDRQEAAEENPAMRLGDVEDVAGATLLLASDAGSYINGQYIIMDGGAMAG